MAYLRFCILTYILSFASVAYSALDPESLRVFNEMKTKAISGDLESQYKLAGWYLQGREPDVKPDKNTAEMWFQKSADKGYKKSYGALSQIWYEKFAYSKDKNPNNLAEAHKWRILYDDSLRSMRFFNVYEMSEQTRAEGEARAKKYRVDHGIEPPSPATK